MSTYRRRTVKRTSRRRAGNTKMRRVARYEAKKVVNRNIENKMWDGRMSLTNIDYNGLTVRLFTNPSAGTTIAQGTASNSYIGQKVRIMYLQLMVQMIYADLTNMGTVIVFQTKGLFSPAGSDMTNVFESTGNDSAPLSFPDRAYNDRFRVIARKTYGVSTNGPSNVIFKFKLKPHQFKYITSFNDASGTQEAGDLYVGIVSDSSITTPPQFNAQWRVYYKDA